MKFEFDSLGVVNNFPVEGLLSTVVLAIYYIWEEKDL